MTRRALEHLRPPFGRPRRSRGGDGASDLGIGEPARALFLDECTEPIDERPWECVVDAEFLEHELLYLLAHTTDVRAGIQSDVELIGWRIDDGVGAVQPRGF